MNRLRQIGKWIAVFLLSFAAMRTAMHFSPDFRLAVYEIRDYVIMARLFPITSKFWAHRCNDTRKLEEVITRYDGVELDIIFCPTADGGVFETSHDPQSAVEHPLDDFFALIAKRKTNVWLDFKNLNETTAYPALHALEKLVKTYQIDKSRLIVESGNHACLGVFHRQGYYTSYYCPVNDDRYLHTDIYKEEYVRMVHEAVQSGNINAISFPASYYPLAKSTGTRLDLLAWRIGHYGWWDFYFDRNLKPLLEDKQVKVLLVSAHSRYNR